MKTSASLSHTGIDTSASLSSADTSASLSSADSPASLSTSASLDSYNSIDPIDLMVRFIQRIIQKQTKNSPITPDRDRLIVTLLLSIIADPHHHLNEYVTRPLLKRYFERGGRCFIEGMIARSLREEDTFDHAVQYLYDYGLDPTEIAQALGSHRMTILRRVRYKKS